MRKTFSCRSCNILTVSERDRESCPLCGAHMAPGLPREGVYSLLTDAERHEYFARVMTAGNGVRL